MFKKIGNFLKNLFTKAFDALEVNAAKAVAIVNALKVAVENPLLDVIVQLTKTKVDDIAVAKVRQYLAIAAEKMLIAEKIIGKNKSEEEIIRELTKFLVDKTPEARAKFYVELGGRIAEILADGKITLSEAISLSQYVFSANKLK